MTYLVAAMAIYTVVICEFFIFHVLLVMGPLPILVSYLLQSQAENMLVLRGGAVITDVFFLFILVILKERSEMMLVSMDGW